MTASCLNRSAIANAVGGGNVNVSLLIDALSPLCPSPPPQAELIANHFGTVVLGYSCGFLPWSFLLIFDFISPQWKTVRDTRRAGYFHIAGSVSPMLVVLGYAALQGVSGDYKEMMTAIAATILTAHHLARTVWGLVQLSAFKKWYRYTAECIWAQYNRSQEEGDETEMNFDYLDNEILVNENIIDNEFTGRNVSVSFNFRKRQLDTLHPEENTLCWAGAYLSTQGYIWHKSTAAKLPRVLMCFLARCTFNSEECGLISLYCLRTTQWYDTNIGAYGSVLYDYICDEDEPFNLYTYELENIVSSFCVSNDDYFLKQIARSYRKEVTVDAVETVLGARLLGPENMRFMASSFKKMTDSISCEEEMKQAWALFQNQIGIEHHIEYDQVHSFWKLMTVPLRGEMLSSSVLQASAHVDIDNALHIGKDIHATEELRDQKPVRGNEFESFTDLVENRSSFRSNSYILGVSLDGVRTTLAKWVSSSDEISPSMWLPRIISEDIVFSASFFVCNWSVIKAEWIAYDEDRRPTDEEANSKEWAPTTSPAILWECQYVLRQKLENLKEETASPSNIALMALFICSYPALLMRCENEKGTLSDESTPLKLSIKPVWAPQDIYISLTIQRSTQESSMKLIAESSETHFQWEDWINAAMAIVKTDSQLTGHTRAEYGFECDRNLDSFQRASLTRPMLHLSAPHDALPNLPRDIEVWTAWPMFDVRVCQFEMDQWMGTAKNLSQEQKGKAKYAHASHEGSSDVNNDQYRKLRKNMEEALMLIESWNRA